MFQPSVHPACHLRSKSHGILVQASDISQDFMASVARLFNTENYQAAFQPLNLENRDGFIYIFFTSKP